MIKVIINIIIFSRSKLFAFEKIYEGVIRFFFFKKDVKVICLYCSKIMFFLKKCIVVMPIIWIKRNFKIQNVKRFFFVILVRGPKIMSFPNVLKRTDIISKLQKKWNNPWCWNMCVYGSMFLNFVKNRKMISLKNKFWNNFDTY